MRSYWCCDRITKNCTDGIISLLLPSRVSDVVLGVHLDFYLATLQSSYRKRMMIINAYDAQ